MSKSKVTARAAGKSRKPSQAELLGQIAALHRSQAILELNMDGTIQHANVNYLKMLGYTLEELQGRHHSMLVEPDLKSSAEYRTFWDKLGNGEFQAGRQKRLDKNGRVVWMRASYNPIMDAKGRPLKIVVFAADITETIRKSADFESQMRAINKAQSVIEFKLDGTVLIANDHFLRTMGYTIEEIRGKHHSMFVDPAYRDSSEYRAFWEKLA
ncbi:MAG TPA: PAS domain S-box protein, partial [Steroidobacteraceae bacterium]|nr:PAS domain S-box protein [Steroidobacteraceae bacterium]